VSHPDDAPFLPRPWPRRDPHDSPLNARRVLVVDPDRSRGRTVAAWLSRAGCAAQACSAEDDLSRRLSETPWEVVVLAPEGAGARVLERLVALEAPPAVLGFQSATPGAGEAELPGEALHGYLPRDADENAVRHAVGRALEQRALAEENRRLRLSLAGRYALGAFLTRDPAMRAALTTVEAVADTRATVLILGESGTGKTLLAQTVHQLSSRRSGPFVVVHCGALPGSLLETELFGHVRGAFSGAVKDRPGRFELAHGGTIFLDEINSAPLDLQVKLLRVLQDRTFERVGESATRTADVRIVAASNADLLAEIEAGRFREDLYWRLYVVAVELPPLRRRPGDLVPLVEHFVARFAREYGKPIAGLHPETLGLLAAHPWPGNVRELENAIERAVLLAHGPLLLPAHLGEGLAPARQASPSVAVDLALGLRNLTELLPLKKALEGPERAFLVRALELCGGNRKRAAEMLAIDRTTLFNKMRKYGLMGMTF